ncbi:MAG: C4-dicarboxylate ABC transporter permease [Rhodobacterales bacterium]|nr:MAG: C4-dicarboxylate ABC transporter permease [Rhodobacterales bacterium]
MGRMIDRLAIGMALAGGGVLLVLIVLTCVSVAGRGLGVAFDWAGPVKGDFEIIEAAMAFAIFAFLPLAQLRGGHPTVNLLTDRLGAGVSRVLAAFWEIVFAGALILITWRLAVGTLDKACLPERWEGAWCSLETSFRLGFPLWWSYAACLVAAALAALTALYCAWSRVALGRLPERPDLHGSL